MKHYRSNLSDLRIHLTEKTLVFSEIQGEIRAPKQEIGSFRQSLVLVPNPGVYGPFPGRMRTGILEFKSMGGEKKIISMIGKGSENGLTLTPRECFSLEIDKLDQDKLKCHF